MWTLPLVCAIEFGFIPAAYSQQSKLSQPMIGRAHTAVRLGSDFAQAAAAAAAEYTGSDIVRAAAAAAAFDDYMGRCAVQAAAAAPAAATAAAGSAPEFAQVALAMRPTAVS